MLLKYMFLLIFLVLSTLVFLYLLGWIPNTLHYDRRMIKHYYLKIMKNDSNCSILAIDYIQFKKHLTNINFKYKLNVYENPYLSYLYNRVQRKISIKCPNIFDCKPLSYDDVKCDLSMLLKFQDYYYQNINQFSNDENIEFHDIVKQNERYGNPCAINVYTDYNTHGYTFDVENTLIPQKNGTLKCEQTIVSHAERK